MFKKQMSTLANLSVTLSSKKKKKNETVTKLQHLLHLLQRVLIYVIALGIHTWSTYCKALATAWSTVLHGNQNIKQLSWIKRFESVPILYIK